MNEIPQIQLEAPKVVEQPKMPPLYQEGATILPQATVGVGYSGINMAAVGESAAKLGIGLVEGFNQSELMDRQNGLEAINQQFESSIKKFAEINDFDTIDYLKSEHWHAVKDLLGFDPEDPNEKGDNLNAKKLLSTARAFNAKLDDTVYSARTGWKDNIAIDNYVKFSEKEDQYIANQQTQDDTSNAIDEVAKRRIKQYTDLSGGRSIDEPLPMSGYTMSQRKLLTQISKDYTSLLEKKDKLKISDPLQGFSTQVRPQFDLIESNLKTAKDLFKKADDLLSSEQISDEAKQNAIRFRSEGTRLYIESQAKRHRLVDQLLSFSRSKWDKEAINPETGESYAYPDYLKDPSGIDAINHLVGLNVIKPEDAHSLIAAYNSEQDVSVGVDMSSVEYVRKQQEIQFKNADSTLEVKTSDAKKKLAENTQAIKVARESGNQNLESLLLQQREDIVSNLRQEARKEILPTLPREVKGKAAISRLLSGQDPASLYDRRRDSISSVDGPENPYVFDMVRMLVNPQAPSLDFSAESYDYLNSLVGSTPTNAVKLYKSAIEKINGLVASAANDIPVSTGSSREKKKIEDATRKINWALGRQQADGKNISSEEAIRFASELGASRINPTGSSAIESSDLPDWNDVEKTLMDNKGNDKFSGNKIPFTMKQVVLTKWFKQIFEKAGQMEDTTEARKYIQDSFNLLITDAPGMKGVKFEDFVPVWGTTDPAPDNSGATKYVEDLLLNPKSNEAIASTAFMMFPRENRDKILSSVKERLRSGTMDQANKVRVDAMLSYMENIHKGYDSQQSVNNYLRSVEISKITPIVSMIADQRTKEVLSYNSDEEVAKDRKSKDQAYVTKAAFPELYRTKLLPAVLKSLKIQGLDDSTLSSKAVQEILGKTLVHDIALYATAAARTEIGDYDYSKPAVIEDTVAALRKKYSSWRWDKTNGFLTQSVGEKPENPTYNQTTAIPTDQIFGGTKVDLGQDRRHILVGLSSPFAYDEQASPEKKKLVLGQVAPSNRADSDQNYGELLKDDPFTGLIAYGVAGNKLISKKTLEAFNSDRQNTKPNLMIMMKPLISAATEGQPKDNLTVMAAIAAIAQIDPSDTDLSRVSSTLKQRTTQIRKAMLDNDSSVYKVSTVEMPSNDGNGTSVPTIVISSNGKTLSTFQPSASFSYTNLYDGDKFSDSLSSYLQSKSGNEKSGLSFGSVAHSMIYNEKIPETTRDAIAVKFLRESSSLSRIGNNRRANIEIGRLGSAEDSYWKEITPDGTLRIYKGIRYEGVTGSISYDTQEGQRADSLAFGKKKLVYEGKSAESAPKPATATPKTSIFSERFDQETKDNIAISALAAEDAIDTKLSSNSGISTFPLGKQWNEYWVEDNGNNSITVYKGVKYTSPFSDAPIGTEMTWSKEPIYSGPRIQQGGNRLRPIPRPIDESLWKVPERDVTEYGQQAQDALNDLLGIVQEKVQTRQQLFDEANAKRKQVGYEPMEMPTKKQYNLWEPPSQAPVAETKGSVVVDWNFLLDNFNTGMPPEQSIKPTIIHDKGKYILVPNSGNYDTDTLTGLYKKDNKSFGYFASREDAMKYQNELNVYLNTMYSNYLSKLNNE